MTIAILLFYCGWEIFSFIVCEYVFPVYREICLYTHSSFYKSFNAEFFISLNLTSLAVLYILMPHVNRYIDCNLLTESKVVVK